MHGELTTLFNIRFPIIQAPMANADSVELASAVTEVGGLGSLGCGMLTPEEVKKAWFAIRAATRKPINLNFFCHNLPKPDEEKQRIWLTHLRKYYDELNIDPDEVTEAPLRTPFNDAMCDVVEELKPEIVSFHFGLPGRALLSRVKATGAKIISTATTLEEGLWLEKMGCDAIIAQGVEAGGHRGMFLTESMATQITTNELVRLLSNALTVPVIAAGGIVDAEGIINAKKSGASAVQLGTAYLFTPEARISPLYLSALTSDKKETAITNIYTGRPARGIITRLMSELGGISEDAPPFPYASRYVAPLRLQAEKNGSIDFSPLFAGENYRLGKVLPAAEITKRLAEEAMID
jgi:nitronate monooxygenase